MCMLLHLAKMLGNTKSYNIRELQTMSSAHTFSPSSAVSIDSAGASLRTCYQELKGSLRVS